MQAIVDFPLAAMVVFVGMALLLWQALRDIAALAKLALNGPSAPQSASPVAVPAAPAALPIAVPAAKPITPAPPVITPSIPPWFTWAQHEIGFHETGNNQGIGKYIALAHCGAEGDPWCAIFANAALEASGMPGTRSPSSQSFRTSPGFVQLPGPALGCLVVYWRISKTSGQGHVGFYVDETATEIRTLGGNENDMVQIEPLPKDSASFGLIGFWWPAHLPLPKVGAIPTPAGAPVHVTTPPSGTVAPVPAPASTAPAHQTGITATVFGGQQSAYGGPIDDNSPGVALPFRFEGGRPRVRVSGNSSGRSVDCDIVDIGPWNLNDPYWQTHTRPQAESGADLGQTGPVRKTNKAGIDLTVAAAKAIQIDGKGLVSWEFVESPLSPKVS